jgi:hypothetical protein
MNINKPLLYQCIVLDNNDPLMLGRIRGRLLSDDYDAVVKSQNFKEKDSWTEKDPFVFKPLLPYFIYQVPLVKELVFSVYYNHEHKYQNQYYVQSTTSSPLNSTFEEYVGGQETTGFGFQISKPKNLKNKNTGLSGTTYDGVFPEPGDNAILGRGRADLIIKENEVLLRAAKTTTKLQPNVDPVGNVGRSFLQLSQFDSVKNFTGVKTFLNFETNTLLVNYLIEWAIFNPDNSQDKFTGQVYLFKLKPDSRVNTSKLKIDSKIDDLKSLVALKEFFALSLDEVTIFINNFINDCNLGNKINGKQVFSSEDTKFPFFYRPNNQMYSIISSPPFSNSVNDINQSKNLKTLFPTINLYTNTPTKGYGLIWKLDTVGIPFDLKKTKESTYEYKTTPTTFGSMGADYLVLLSHLSEIDGKKYINLQNTLYGINNDKFSDEILPNTSSMVRGEELLELLNKIVYFLVTHTHSYPLLPPDEQTYTDSNVPDLLAALNNASSKVLNKYIRLN